MTTTQQERQQIVTDVVARFKDEVYDRMPFEIADVTAQAVTASRYFGTDLQSVITLVDGHKHNFVVKFDKWDCDRWKDNPDAVMDSVFSLLHSKLETP